MSRPKKVKDGSKLEAYFASWRTTGAEVAGKGGKDLLLRTSALAAKFGPSVTGNAITAMKAKGWIRKGEERGSWFTTAQAPLRAASGGTTSGSFDPSSRAATSCSAG